MLFMVFCFFEFQDMGFLKVALTQFLEVIGILIIVIFGVAGSGILHPACQCDTYYYYRIVMGNTCKTDFAAVREEGVFTELSTKETKVKKDSDQQVKMCQFPELSKAALHRIEELVDMDFSEQEGQDNTKRQYKKEAYKLENGWIYQGQWHNKKIWGKGRYYTPKGSYVECYSVDGKPVGKVRIVHPNGDFYQGLTNNFKANGKGILIQNSVQYEGNFVDNYLNGEGREESEDYIFEGIYQKGKKVSGKLVWNIGKENETMYDGKFYNEKFDGRGCIYNNLGTFRGFFKDGKKFGDGVFIWKNGARFQGEYENDMKNGPGIMFNPKGVLVLRTVWENDKPILKSSAS